jgi:MSHA biogenesis protein MshI
VEFRWPFKKKNHDQWIGIDLYKEAPSVVVQSRACIEDCASFNQQGMEALDQWLDRNIGADAPAVLVLDEAQYELLLVEAPEVPEEELADAISFRIADMLSQPIEDMAIQAFRLPPDAYRGRMNMAYVVASPKETIRDIVGWAEKRRLKLEQITVPEMSLLQTLAAHNNAQNSAILELKEGHGVIRLYSDGALYLTRQVEVGFKALGFDAQSDAETHAEEQSEQQEILELSADDISQELEEQSTGGVLLNELDFDQLALEETQAKDNIDDLQTENLILEIQRSLDYYESQLGMGQINNLWVFSSQVDLSALCEKIKPMIHTKAKQLDLNSSLPKAGVVDVSASCVGLNNALISLGGALSYVAS